MILVRLSGEQALVVLLPLSSPYMPSEDCGGIHALNNEIWASISRTGGRRLEALLNDPERDAEVSPVESDC